MSALTPLPGETEADAVGAEGCDLRAARHVLLAAAALDEHVAADRSSHTTANSNGLFCRQAPAYLRSGRSNSPRPAIGLKTFPAAARMASRSTRQPD